MVGITAMYIPQAEHEMSRIKGLAAILGVAALMVLVRDPTEAR